MRTNQVLKSNRKQLKLELIFFFYVHRNVYILSTRNTSLDESERILIFVLFGILFLTENLRFNLLVLKSLLKISTFLNIRIENEIK